MSIGRLEPVPLRTLWPREDADFTHWLAENLDALAEHLNLSLTLEEQEARVGDFMVDLLAKTEDGRLVVIENQLGRTDHDHLGKLLTYLTNFEAKIGVWLCADPRPEHQRAVQWLNEVAPDDMAFYLVKVEAFRIGDSPAAPWFRVVAGPTPEARALGRQRKELAEREILRQRFWAHLLERARNRTKLHARRKPTTSHSLDTGAGKTGLFLTYVILKDRARVELYINRPNADENKRIFDQLFAHREEIEQAFGDSLLWQRLDQSRASRIAYYVMDRGLRHQEDWPQIQEAMIDAMIRLEQALRPFLKQI